MHRAIRQDAYFWMGEKAESSQWGYWGEVAAYEFAATVGVFP